MEPGVTVPHPWGSPKPGPPGEHHLPAAPESLPAPAQGPESGALPGSPRASPRCPGSSRRAGPQFPSSGQPASATARSPANPRSRAGSAHQAPPPARPSAWGRSGRASASTRCPRHFLIRGSRWKRDVTRGCPFPRLPAPFPFAGPGSRGKVFFSFLQFPSRSVPA